MARHNRRMRPVDNGTSLLTFPGEADRRYRRATRRSRHAVIVF